MIIFEVWSVYMLKSSLALPQRWSHILTILQIPYQILNTGIYF